ncbi:MAG: MFS transporter [Actinobacteria bacterium]|nr:MFS transporter [Actinomycetota bacterium]
METFPIRRNTILLAGTLTCLSGMVQLAVAVATITLVLVTGIEGILGLGPAIFLAAAALAALPAGRAMDHYGRIPVLAAGCCAGIAGCALTALGCEVESAVLVVAGFALVGTASGTVLLARAAAADMYPPARRARGISFVLFGSLFGAALGPLVFRPLFAGKELDTDALVVPWLAAGGIMAIGLVLVLLVRPDPKRIALQLTGGAAAGAPPPQPAAPLREIIRRPGVPTALVAAVASFAGMVSVMNLTGYIVIDHGHHQTDVFTVISLHIVGMYALVLVIGELIDRLGRKQGQVSGLLLMGLSTLGLAWFDSVLWTSVSLFGLGLGWNVSYVAAATELADRALPAERGKLIGFSDLLSSFTGASLALLGGAAYSALGVAALAFGATAFVALPAVWILLQSAAGAREVRPLSVKRSP